MSANRKAALALAAWLAVLPGFTVAETYTEENTSQTETQGEGPAAEEIAVQEAEEETPVPQQEEPEQEEPEPEKDQPQEEEPEAEKPAEEEPQEEKPEEKPAEQEPVKEEPAGDNSVEPAAPTENGGAQTDTQQTPDSPVTVLPAGEKEAPKPVVVDMPDEEDDWKPWGQAWTELEDGERTAGTLEEVLAWLEGRLDEDAEATVYLREKLITANNVSLRLLERVGFEPDGEVFSVDKYEYDVLVDSDDVMTLEATEEDGEEDVRVSIRVQVQNKNAPAKDDGNGTDNPSNGNTSNPSNENGTDNPSNGNASNPSNENGTDNSSDGNGENNSSNGGTAGTENPAASPSTSPSTSETPAPTPTPVPKPVLKVTAEGYEPDIWKNSPPSFTLSGIPEGSSEYVYGVFICDERLILLSNGNDMYVPQDEGMTSVRFAILDKMGDVQSISDQYDMLLDFTPPDGPYLSGDDDCKTVCYVTADDWLSGLNGISYDGGETWDDYTDPEQEMSFLGDVGETVEAGQICVRDNAGNISSNAEEFTFGKKKSTGTGTGTGNGKKPIRHVKETMDYSKANYNALELNVSDQPQTELTIGGTALGLSLTDEDQVKPFSVELTTWQTTAGETPSAPNTLVLTAAGRAQTSVWRFGGEAYKLLYNSGVEYLVFASGDYITVIPTEGFTGGTQYGKLKASGVSTRKFEYTLIQDETLRETTLSVQVEGETYLLEENTQSPMYRYNVLVGTKDMMKKPYESYKPGKEAL